MKAQEIYDKVLFALRAQDAAAMTKALLSLLKGADQ